MKSPLLFILSLLLAGVSAQAVAAPESVTRTYRVQQNVILSEIPAGTKVVKWWIAIPDDERFQEVLDFKVVSAPAQWRIVREPDHGNRFMEVEIISPNADTLSAKVEFLLRRRSVFVDIDPSKVGAITDANRALFVDDLRQDAPHMEVSPAIAALANKACGTETNLATQAILLLNAVADYADHYSKDPSKPKCSVGDAGDCMANAGGCCTDLHSMFIAMARSRGIPPVFRWVIASANRTKARRSTPVIAAGPSITFPTTAGCPLTSWKRTIQRVSVARAGSPG